MKFISKEIEILKRKKQRLEEEKDSENRDSHIKAIALTLHSIYTGYEKILEILIKGVDGDLPSSIDFHTALIKRASYEIPEVRPRIISEETFHAFNILRGYRHRLRRIYMYLISPIKVLHLTDLAIKSYNLFQNDWLIFKNHLLKKA